MRRFTLILVAFCGLLGLAPPRACADNGAPLAGKNVARAKDDSLFALIHGVVRFEDRGGRGKFISVLTVEEASASADEKKSAAAAAD